MYVHHMQKTQRKETSNIVTIRTAAGHHILLGREDYEKHKDSFAASGSKRVRNRSKDLKAQAEFFEAARKNPELILEQLRRPID
jgi:hypothetical protein